MNKAYLQKIIDRDFVNVPCKNLKIRVVKTALKQGWELIIPQWDNKTSYGQYVIEYRNGKFIKMLCHCGKGRGCFEVNDTPEQIKIRSFNSVKIELMTAKENYYDDED